MRSADRAAAWIHRLRQAVLPGKNLDAFVILLVTATLAGAFTFSYTAAFSDPRPDDVPIAVVGVSNSRVQSALDAIDDGGFIVREVPSPASGLALIDSAQVFGVLDATREPAVLDISSASAPSVASVVAAQADPLGERLGIRIDVRDVHPESSDDPRGLLFFYLSLGAVITGFAGAAQTATNTVGLPLASLVGWTALRAAVTGFVLALVGGPLLHVQPLPVWAAAGILALTNWTAAAIYALAYLIVGPRWAMLPTWVVFVLIGDPNAGGVVASPLLPAPLAVLGQYLPTGASVCALVRITYFADVPFVLPFAVLTAWALISGAAWIILARAQLRRRTGSRLHVGDRPAIKSEERVNA